MEAYGGVEIEEMDYEEDTDDIPLMKFDCGKAGKHLLVVDNRSELDFYHIFAPISRDTDTSEGGYDRNPRAVIDRNKQLAVIFRCRKCNFNITA